MTEEEYFAKKKPVLSNYMRTKPLYECPECGKLSVCKDDSVVLTSFPPKYRYQCLAHYGGCGKYETYR